MPSLYEVTYENDRVCVVAKDKPKAIDVYVNFKARRIIRGGIHDGTTYHDAAVRERAERIKSRMKDDDVKLIHENTPIRLDVRTGDVEGILFEPLF
ncbi:hypothetical protein HYT24_00410 [Candidatus Pacearchaeota archaeon]|nr:hypothetical protein [Candidatus Pacearchaeota archaeon]